MLQGSCPSRTAPVFFKIAGTFLQLFEKNAAKFPQFFVEPTIPMS